MPDTASQAAEDTPLLPRSVSRARSPARLSRKAVLCPLFGLAFLVSLFIAFLLFVGFEKEKHSGGNDSWIICSQDGEKQVYTVEDGRNGGWQDCVQIDREKGRFGKVGDQAHVGPPTHILPSGSILTPGFSDSHVHMIEYGFSRSLDLANLNTLKAVIEKVKKYVEEEWDGEGWVEGQGWYENVWEDWEGGFPTKNLLDAEPTLRDVPIMLSRKDLHAQWVNSKVLSLTNTLPETVEGGEVLRDANGDPTGIFLDQAQALLPVPEWSETRQKGYYLRAAKEALQLGVTKCHDAMTSEVHIEYYKRWADAGELPMRMYLMANRDSGKGYWGHITKLHNYGKHGRLNLRAIKLVGDGSLGSCSAVMFEPYDDPACANKTGFFRVPLEEMRDFVPRFFEDGWQVNIHAIGDKANSEVLSILEGEMKGKGREQGEWRPRIEHVQMVREEDFERFGKSGVIASIQPTHATSDMAYAEERLGKERAAGAYAFRKLINAGARITLGSDFPVESNNPLVTFYAAITRLTAEGTSPHGPSGWFPEQRLTREEAIKGLTLDPAYASFSEEELGSVKEGKKADFVVWDRNLLSVKVQDVLASKVLVTAVDGRVGFGGMEAFEV